MNICGEEMKVPMLSSLYRNNFNWSIRKYYAFRHRFGLPTLKFIHWITTFKCNFTCKGCEASAGKAAVDELTTAEAFDLIKDIADMRVKSIYLSGGELLTRDDIFEIIREINRNSIHVGIATNGFLVRRYENELKKCRLDWMFTSIDGLESHSDSYRGVPGAFRRSLDALDFFKKEGVPKRIVVSVIHPENIDDLPELGETIANSSATEWRLSPCKPAGNAIDSDNLLLSDEQVKQIATFIMQNRSRMRIEFTDTTGFHGHLDPLLRCRPFFCTAGIKSCAVLAEGSVIECVPPYTANPSEGNIRNEPLSHIWKEGFQKIRNPVLPVKCKNCIHLKSCNAGCQSMRRHGRGCYIHIWDGWNEIQ